MSDVLTERTNVLLSHFLKRSRSWVDRLFIRVLCAQWAFAILCALWISPRTWTGAEIAPHVHIWTAIILGGVIVSIPLLLARIRPGAALTRHVIAIAQMLFSALLIHLMGGRIETHFHIFGSLAFLAFYRDGKLLITATAVVVTDHVVRGYFWPQAIFGSSQIEFFRWGEHILWVLYANVVLWIAVRASLTDRVETCRSIAELEHTKQHIEDMVGERSSALRRSEAMFRNIVETAQEGIWLVDGEGRITFVNNRLIEMLGYAEEDMIGQGIETFMDESRSEASRRLARDDENPVIEKRDVRLIHRYGHDVWCQVATKPVNDDAGIRLGTLGLVTDISGRRLDESRVRSAHMESELLLSSISSALIGLDAKGNVQRWNTVAMEMFGLGERDVMGKSLEDLSIDADHQAITAISTGNAEGRYELQAHLRGEERILEIMVCRSPAPAGRNRLARLLLVNDVTEHRIAQQLRAQGSKLESVGQLAAGIAHEINTPVQFVGDNLRFLSEAFADIGAVQAAYAELRRQIDDHAAAVAVDETVDRVDMAYLDEEVPKAITQGLEGVDRIATIVRALKEFSHPDGGAMQEVNLAQAIASTLVVARNEYKYVAELESRLDGDMPRVRCIGGEINQVILNLVVNAAHAIGDVVKGTGKMGKITVALQRDGEHAVITVADTGTGIPDHIHKRIFDPFFTTKGVGKGTGQGLYITREIVVKKHGGTLSVDSTHGQGTTFTIRLPIEGIRSPE